MGTSTSADTPPGYKMVDPDGTSYFCAPLHAVATEAERALAARGTPDGPSDTGLKRSAAISAARVVLRYDASAMFAIVEPPPERAVIGCGTAGDYVPLQPVAMLMIEAAADGHATVFDMIDPADSTALFTAGWGLVTLSGNVFLKPGEAVALLAGGAPVPLRTYELVSCDYLLGV